MITKAESAALTQAGHDFSSIPEEVVRQLFWEVFQYGVNGEQVHTIVTTMKGLLTSRQEKDGFPLYFVPTDIPAVAALIKLAQHAQASKYRCEGELVSPDEDSHDIRVKWNNTLYAALEFEKMFKTIHSMEETEKVIHFVRGLSITLWEVAGLGKYVEVSPAMARSCKAALKRIPVEVPHA